VNVNSVVAQRPTLKSLFHPVTPVEVPGSLPVHSGWADLDLSPYIPPGVRAVILEVYNASTGSVKYGVRENGSTDDRYSDLSGSCKCYAVVGVDANGKIEFKNSWSLNAGARLVVIGFVQNDARVVVNTNAATDILSGMALGAWTAVDLSVACPGAIAVILDVIELNGPLAFGFRKNGSTDARIATTYGLNCFTAIVGCDAGQIIEAYHQAATCQAFVRGYITADFTFNTNATDRSIAALGVYTDIQEPIGAGMVIMEVVSAGSFDFDLKGKGRINGQQKDAQLHCWAIVPTSDAWLIQGYIENAGTDFYEIGYANILR
jgi:hypothetical protein